MSLEDSFIITVEGDNNKFYIKHDTNGIYMATNDEDVLNTSFANPADIIHTNIYYTIHQFGTTHTHEFEFPCDLTFTDSKCIKMSDKVYLYVNSDSADKVDESDSSSDFDYDVICPHCHKGMSFEDIRYR